MQKQAFGGQKRERNEERSHERAKEAQEEIGT